MKLTCQFNTLQPLYHRGKYPPPPVQKARRPPQVLLSSRELNQGSSAVTLATTRTMYPSSGVTTADMQDGRDRHERTVTNHRLKN